MQDLSNFEISLSLVLTLSVSVAPPACLTRRSIIADEHGARVLPRHAVSPVFAISEFVKPHSSELSQSVRQRAVHDRSPRAAIGWAPIPAISMEVVIAAANKIQVIRNADRHIEGGFRQENHGRSRTHDNR